MNQSEILRQFDVPQADFQFDLLKRGHINDTYVVSNRVSNVKSYVLQRVNEQVFPDIPKLMENAALVMRHIASKLATQSNSSDRCMEIIPTLSGKLYYLTDTGEYWRLLTYVEHSKSYDICLDSEKAYAAAALCGRFQSYVMDLDVSLLHETIPLFHNTPNRYRLFHKAISADPLGRVKDISKQIDFALMREAWAGEIANALDDGTVPWRATHNDLKYNNVLFDTRTGAAISLIDIDTYMPGSPAYDFGDMARNASVSVAEDETDLSKVVINTDLFEALAKGYLNDLRDSLLPLEIEMCCRGASLMTLTIGLRFLTDFINGDKYFRISRPSQNLDRARCQFKIVESMEAQRGTLDKIFEAFL